MPCSHAAEVPQRGRKKQPLTSRSSLVEQGRSRACAQPSACTLRTAKYVQVYRRAHGAEAAGRGAYCGERRVYTACARRRTMPSRQVLIDDLSLGSESTVHTLLQRAPGRTRMTTPPFRDARVPPTAELASVVVGARRLCRRGYHKQLGGITCDPRIRSDGIPTHRTAECGSTSECASPCVADTASRARCGSLAVL